MGTELSSRTSSRSSKKWVAGKTGRATSGSALLVALDGKGAKMTTVLEFFETLKQDSTVWLRVRGGEFAVPEVGRTRAVGHWRRLVSMV